MKALSRIVSLFVIICINSCKSKIKCSCSEETVCISLENNSGQELQNISILNKGISKATIATLQMNDQTCLTFNSAGENIFNLTVNFKNGKTIKSSEVYFEGGYKFSAIVTEDKIKVDYNASY